MSTYQIPLGPVHAVLEEPIYFQLTVAEDKVTGVEIFAGYVHRGIEFLAMQRNIYQNITLTERVCSLCSNNHPFTYCMAVEKIAGITIPPRAAYLRIIADESKRIASHLFNTGMLAHLAGAEDLFRQVMEIREVMQDLKEAVYGNRMNLSANCVGGVRYDLSAEQIKFMRESLNKIKKPVEEVTWCYRTEAAFRARTEGIGILPPAVAAACGVVGPVARGSGLAYDVRVDNPYAAYGELTVNAVVEQHGDVAARAMVRLQEIMASVDLLEQALSRLPDGPVCLPYMPEIPAGQTMAKSEAPRGELVYYLRTDGTDIPQRLKWRVPTYQNWEALPVMLANSKVADVPLIISSIDPCVSCTDR
ncbi:MAG TPA: nickel-dependent hydrogenase large subunit [Negativicutes bacterium]|nr:nickel-dependent hydrogenase large subunit [Negativicutes bacterium]